MAILILLLFILTATFSAADDSAGMKGLLTSLTPTPTNWAFHFDYCVWSGVQCDATKSVVSIDLSSRSLSGNLRAVGNLTALVRLKLSDNRFTGRLPDFSGCTALKELHLRSNEFTGLLLLTAMPKSLKKLSVDGNYFQGPLPDFWWWGIEASYSNNSFCRDLPVPCDPQVTSLLRVVEEFGFPLRLAQAWRGNDACSWVEMILCDVSGKVVMVTMDDHKLGGIISPEFGNLRYLRYLILKGNGLWGYIPERLTNLSELQMLDILENDLFGEVPAFRRDVVVITYGNPFLTPSRPVFSLTPSPGVRCWGRALILGLVCGLVIGLVFVFSIWSVR